MSASLGTDVQVFKSLPQREVSRLVQTSRVSAFSPGTIVTGAGEPDSPLHVVLSGSLRLEARVPGSAQPTILAEFAPGELVLSPVLPSGVSPSAAVVADQVTTTLAIRPHEVAALQQGYPAFERALHSHTRGWQRILTARLIRSSTRQMVDASIDARTEASRTESRQERSSESLRDIAA